MNQNLQEELNQALKDAEVRIDKEIEQLSLWKYPFQTIFSTVLYQVEKIDFDDTGDSAGDYLGRIAELHKVIQMRAAKAEEMTTTNALLTSIDDLEFFEDIRRLYKYGHFSMIMPQVHRKVFQITKDDENSFRLTYPSKEFEQAELKDKILGVLSEQFSHEFLNNEAMDRYLVQRIDSGETVLCEKDQPWIEELYLHHMYTQFRVEVLTDDILTPHLGFSNMEYNQFVAAFKAFCDFSIALGRAFNRAAEATEDRNKAELFMSEYMENVVCSLNQLFLEQTKPLCGLQDDSFKAILGYFAQKYENTAYQINCYSACGDGYLPPFELTKNQVIFSPHSIRYLHTFNNILYSVNKKRQDLFNNQISSSLEPVLINQVEQLFTAFPDLKIKKNIIYTGSEIDMLVLSEKEQVCLVFQAKATLAPASSRTLSRVQDRSIEGIEQIKKFEALEKADQLNIINGCFGTDLQGLKIISILLVRSSAGSEDVWNIGISCVNHSFLSGMLARKISQNDEVFIDFDQQINKYMDELIEVSGWVTNEEKFELNGLTLKFPDMDMKFNDVLRHNHKSAVRFRSKYWKAL
jgi:hypothetical protein